MNDKNETVKNQHFIQQMILKSFTTSKKPTHCYKYIKDKEKPFLNNTKDIGSGDYFYGTFDSEISSLEVKTNHILQNIIENNTLLCSDDDFSSLLMFYIARSGAFRLYLINMFIDGFQFAINKLNEEIENLLARDIESISEEQFNSWIIDTIYLSDEEFKKHLKEKINSRQVRRIILKTRDKYIKELKVLKNIKALRNQSQEVFMGLHNIIIHKYVMSELKNITQTQTDITPYIYTLPYEIPLGDTVCFFYMKGKQGNLEFVSCSLLDSIDVYDADIEAIFMPLTPQKILVLGTQSENIMKAMTKEKLICAIVSTSYQFFIANNDSFTQFLPLIGNTSSSYSNFIHKLLTEVLNIETTDKPYLPLYKEMFVDLKNKMNTSLNYSTENKDLNNMDIANKFLNEDHNI